jgi:hypothetical protein
MFSRAQVPSYPTTIVEIMSDPKFEQGVHDARAGRGYPGNYEAWDDNGMWDYERGRAWAKLVPRTVRLKHNGKITAAAVAWFRRFDADII